MFSIPPRGETLPGRFDAPEQLDVQWLGAAADECLPFTLPVEHESELIRIFRILEQSVPHRAQSFRPTLAGDLAISSTDGGLPERCSRDPRAVLGWRHRGHAEHRSTWLAANEQPLLRLARDAEHAEGLW